MDDNSFATMADQVNGAGRFAADSAAFVVFSVKAVKDEAASREEGRPIYHEVEYIRIMTPGNKTNIVERPVRDTDKMRYQAQYERFRKGLEGHEQVSGIPLEQWPVLNTAQVAELRALNILTVEMLANASDGEIGKYMGLPVLKQKAIEYLSRVNDEAPLNKLQAENEALRQEMEVLKAQMAEMSKPKRGRPRKTQAEIQ